MVTNIQPPHLMDKGPLSVRACVCVCVCMCACVEGLWREEGESHPPRTPTRETQAVKHPAQLA